MQEIGEHTLDNGSQKIESGTNNIAAASSTQYSNKRSTTMTALVGNNMTKNASNIGMAMLFSEGSNEHIKYDESAYENH